MSTLNEQLQAIGVRAREAAKIIRSADSATKNNALLRCAQSLATRRSAILQQNAVDVDQARNSGKTDAFLDRLALDEVRLDGIADALRQIAELDDPVGATINEWRRPNGLEIARVRTPIGVVAVIYESRPNVTIDAAAIAMKAGNAVILRGGSEAIGTNRALHDCFRESLCDAGLPESAVQFVDTPDRDAVGALLSGLDGAVDLVIPRGGKSLVARVQSDARVPVLSHLDGVCHVYLDRDADMEKAVSISLNSKMRRTGVCGAAETLLIDKTVLEKFWPPVAQVLREANCELRGDKHVQEIDRNVTPAGDEDWDTEYLAPILSVAAVDGVGGAIDHIARHSSGHTEAIVTEDKSTAERFLSSVDSAIVLHNASTQYADGGEFGLGAEIGIATGRLHARGPVGVEELTIYKNIVRGGGQIRP